MICYSLALRSSRQVLLKMHKLCLITHFAEFQAFCSSKEVSLLAFFTLFGLLLSHRSLRLVKAPVHFVVFKLQYVLFLYACYKQPRS